jgi:hypothetical protein
MTLKTSNRYKSKWPEVKVFFKILLILTKCLRLHLIKNFYQRYLILANFLSKIIYLFLVMFLYIPAARGLLWGEFKSKSNCFIVLPSANPIGEIGSRYPNNFYDGNRLSLPILRKKMAPFLVWCWLTWVFDDFVGIEIPGIQFHYQNRK